MISKFLDPFHLTSKNSENTNRDSLLNGKRLTKGIPGISFYDQATDLTFLPVPLMTKGPTNLTFRSLTMGAFFWDYSGIGILGMDGICVLLGAIPFSE